ncbi:MAG: type II toxin-antitoxin system ParD family antitoxin [Verrucomicrobia bacterium]|nr:type II toxin-antitoxin system ParD family antitoxin [Verrucomicrobiota bacterium]
MTIALSPGSKKILRKWVASGRYRDEGDVIRAGLRALDDREKERARLAALPDGHGTKTVAELLAEADADEYRPWNPAKDFAAVRAELRARLKAPRRKAA